jgi:hypothetical protein
MGTAHNRTICASPPYGGSDYEKTQSGLRPLYGFTPPTFGAGVNAPHCPIARPKRHIQPERYVQVDMGMSEASFTGLYRDIGNTFI